MLLCHFIASAWRHQKLSFQTLSFITRNCLLSKMSLHSSLTSVLTVIPKKKYILEITLTKIRHCCMHVNPISKYLIFVFLTPYYRENMLTKSTKISSSPWLTILFLWFYCRCCWYITARRFYLTSSGLRLPKKLVLATFLIIYLPRKRHTSGLLTLFFNTFWYIFFVFVKYFMIYHKHIEQYSSNFVLE